MYFYALIHTHTPLSTTSNPLQVDVPDDIATVAHLIKWSVVNVSPFRPRDAVLQLTLHILRSWLRGRKCSSLVTTCERYVHPPLSLLPPPNAPPPQPRWYFSACERR
jgi:hypothetical protein